MLFEEQVTENISVESDDESIPSSKFVERRVSKWVFEQQTAPADFPIDEPEVEPEVLKENVEIKKKSNSKNLPTADPPFNQLNVNNKKEPIDILERFYVIFLEQFQRKIINTKKYWHDNQLEGIYPIILEVLRNGYYLLEISIEQQNYVDFLMRKIF